MNSKHDILYGILLILISGCCMQSCQQDDLDAPLPDKDSLIARGRYLTALSEDAFSLADELASPKPFNAGTPYRLLAFTKPYDGNDPKNEENTHNTPRFNKVAWEGRTSDKIRFINIDSDPDKWFGFSALEGEEGDTDGLVSLDFYGFTYGKPQETHPSDYIELDNLNADTKPAQGSLETLRHTETVTDNRLNDLMWGRLLNQNIATAGADNDSTQSIISFGHSFSKLRFQVSQQGDEEHPDADGKPKLSFKNLKVESVTVTNTYAQGSVYLQDGKVKVSGPTERPLQLKEDFDGSVGFNNTDIGEMIIFPSHSSAFRDEDNMPEGYKVGLEITVKSTEKTDIQNMLRNTGGDDTAITEETIGGTTWYKGTIKKSEILNYYNEKPNTLYFKQNTSYILIIAFKDDAVRIITVIPQIEEWLPGEGTSEDPWEYHEMGQPQMFDNVVWSDRNLGADHYDPTGDNFEKTMGYFYQAGRNIPYYPFKWSNYNTDKGEHPTISDLDKIQHFADNNTNWNSYNYRFYPVVDEMLLKMGSPKWWVITREAVPKHNPQMMIPEKKPTEDKCFDFMVDKSLYDDDMKWNEKQANQPVTGAWVIPTSNDYLSIFPSTPHAGNITFNQVGSNFTNPGDWGLDGTQDGPIFQMSDIDVIRVTVPYYKAGSTDADAPDISKLGKSQKYLDAWYTLKKNNDEGTTHLEKYTHEYKSYDEKAQEWKFYYINGAPDKAINLEPNGDPEDGYASVYVISRAGEDKKELPKDLKDKFVVKSWGTIYAIKRVYTPKAYRMRWRALIAAEGKNNPSIYLEICRYRCNATDSLTETNYSRYDWEHPAARIYFPVCGMGDYTGEYINYGTECVYATSDPIDTNKGMTSAVQIKLTGNNASNAYISIVKGNINRHFGMQIRPVIGDKQ